MAINRKCKRCGQVKSSEVMHFNNQMKCWLCDDRQDCTRKLTTNKNKE